MMLPLATPPCDLSPRPDCFKACQACPSVPSQCLQGVYASLQAYRPAPQALRHCVHRSSAARSCQACQSVLMDWCRFAGCVSLVPTGGDGASHLDVTACWRWGLFIKHGLMRSSLCFYRVALARLLRLNREGAWYHVTARGNERRAIFQNERDRVRFVKLLPLWQERFRVRLHAYMLMPRYHLLELALCLGRELGATVAAVSNLENECLMQSSDPTSIQANSRQHPMPRFEER